MDKVVVQQDREFRMAMMALNEGQDELHEVRHIHELSPYTMMLAGLASCTNIVTLSYAQHHDVDLDLVETTVIYHREEKADPTSGKPYDEWIEEGVTFEGDLSDQERDRLEHVARACSIRKMYESGIEIRPL